MTASRSIAIFTSSAAKTAYLAQLAERAGLSVAEEGLEAELALCEGKVPENIKARVIFMFGEGKDGNGVRYLGAPVKASALIALLQNAQNSDKLTVSILKIGDHALDLRESLWIPLGKNPVRLTEKEVAILSYLLQAKESGRSSTVSREDLLSCVWEYAQGVETHTLETHIYRLRQKIEEDPSRPQIILTREEGYALGL